MTRAVVVSSDLQDSAQAGAQLAAQVREQLRAERPDALVVFVSPRHDYGALLGALEAGCAPHVMIGSSSSGEFTSRTDGEGLACAVALQSDEIRFQAAVGRGLSTGQEAAVEALVGGLHGVRDAAYGYRAALIFTDALAGHAEELVNALTVRTGGTYVFAGGGAGGDAQFGRRAVFLGTEVVPDGAVALEMLSNKPIGLGVRHGWRPVSERMRVTAAQGSQLQSLNATPAAEVFEEHAQATGQSFDARQALPFFLHNVLGVQHEAGGRYRIRVPLAVGEHGAVTCATEVPSGTFASIMGVDVASAASAAAESTQEALRQLGDHKPAVALFFDCVATRLRMGADFGVELDAVRRTLGDVPFAGCNSIGQIARAEDQFSGFHNCTAVVCVLPA